MNIKWKQSITRLFGYTQGPLKLIWTADSEGKLQSCLALRNFQTPFNKDKSEGLKEIPCKKGLKLAPVVELAKLYFTYITVLK